MFTFLLKRFYQAVIVMFVISLVAFSIQDNLGDPLRELVGQSVSEAQRHELREKMGLNDPFLIKYSRFLKNAVHGDLGTAYFFKRPALEVILDKQVSRSLIPRLKKAGAEGIVEYPLNKVVY